MAVTTRAGVREIPRTTGFALGPADAARGVAFQMVSAIGRFFSHLAADRVRSKKLLALPGGQCYAFFSLPPRAESWDKVVDHGLDDAGFRRGFPLLRN